MTRLAIQVVLYALAYWAVAACVQHLTGHWTGPWLLVVMYLELAVSEAARYFRRRRRRAKRLMRESN